MYHISLFDQRVEYKPPLPGRMHLTKIQVGAGKKIDQITNSGSIKDILNNYVI